MRVAKVPRNAVTTTTEDIKKSMFTRFLHFQNVFVFIVDVNHMSCIQLLFVDTYVFSIHRQARKTCTTLPNDASWATMPKPPFPRTVW